MKVVAAVIIAFFLVAGCSSQNSVPARGSLVRIDYARIIGMERVIMPSNAPAGAMIGGFTGLMISSGRSGSAQVASGIGGAALGALAANALDGDRRGYQYLIQFNNQSRANFTTDKGFFQVNDCIAVERGQYANIRRVPESFCNGAAVSPTLTAEYQRMAEQCIEAKNQLLASSTTEDVDIAAQKVSVLCQDFD